MRPFAMGGLALALAACATARPQEDSAPGGAQMAGVEGGAGRLHVDDGGSGPATPVVFHHGLGSNLEVWRAQLDHLRPTRRAIAFDARGHGDSEPARDGVYTIAALADDLDRVVTALGVQKFWLVGHSLSGAVLSLYATTHPEKLAGLVYVDAVGDASRAAPEVKEQMLKLGTDPGFGPEQMRAAFGEMMGDKARPATRRAVGDSAARTPVPAFVGLRRSMIEMDYATPSKVYTGPRAAVEALGNQSGHRASVVFRLKAIVIPNVSHWLMLDAPEAMNRALDEVLK